MAKEKGAVVITGASTGIGRATALYLDEKGYRVFAGVRKQKDANALKKEGSDRLTPITLDVTKPQSIKSAKAKVQRAVGKAGIVGLVNNAGIANAGPVEHIPLDVFREVVEVNLTGQVATTQEFLPLLRRAKRGTVVFITSIGGRVAYPFMSPYHAAKWGLEAVAISLRREVKPWKIRVVAVEPGSIATEIWDRGTDNFERTAKQMPREAGRLYGKQMKAASRAMIASGKAGIDPERVAKVVERAIRSIRPRTRYLVGIDARMTLNANRVLSARTVDRVVRRAMKLPNEAPPGR
jgi:NAD(P)-dependent dehydrogenase (short-subunit alcohol dehydrogenase family)